MAGPLVRFDLPRRIYAAEISPAALRVIMALGEYADREGHCWPSQARLGRDCRIDRATVNRAIAELIEAGFLLVVGRKHRACRYQIISPGRAASCDETVTEGARPVEKADLFTANGRSVTKPSQEPVTTPSHKPTQGTRIEPEGGEASKGLGGARRPGAGPQARSEARPSASHERGAAKGPRKSGSSGPAGGRAGSPRGRGAKSVPSTGPPRSPNQRAKDHLSAVDYGKFLLIAAEGGEEAALNAFDLDERGNPRCPTHTTPNPR